MTVFFYSENEFEELHDISEENNVTEQAEEKAFYIVLDSHTRPISPKESDLREQSA